MGFDGAHMAFLAFGEGSMVDIRGSPSTVGRGYANYMPIRSYDPLGQYQGPPKKER